MNVTEYFDSNGHHHNYDRKPEFYSSLADYINSTFPPSKKLRILDVGCGNGSFIKKLLEYKINAQYVGVDPSKTMIGMAREQLKGMPVELYVTSGFDIKEQFDVIHMDSVLHHLITKTHYGSKKMAARMVQHLASLLSGGGILIVGEVFYHSHVIPSFTSSLIFHGLKFFNTLGMDGSKINKEIQPGLEVNFFTEKMIIAMLSKYGEVRIFKREVWSLSKQYRYFLLKEMGHEMFVMHKDA